MLKVDLPRNAWIAHERSETAKTQTNHLRMGGGTALFLGALSYFAGARLAGARLFGSFNKWNVGLLTLGGLGAVAYSFVKANHSEKLAKHAEDMRRASWALKPPREDVLEITRGPELNSKVPQIGETLRLNDVVTPLLLHMPANLKHLELDHSLSEQGFTDQSLQKLVVKNPDLETLTLRNAKGITAQSMAHLAGLKSLTRLDISGCTGIQVTHEWCNEGSFQQLNFFAFNDCQQFGANKEFWQWLAGLSLAGVEFKGLSEREGTPAVDYLTWAQRLSHIAHNGHTEALNHDSPTFTFLEESRSPECLDSLSKTTMASLTELRLPTDCVIRDSTLAKALERHPSIRHLTTSIIGFNDELRNQLGRLESAHFVVAKDTDIRSLFEKATELKRVYLRGWSSSLPTDTALFEHCAKLKELEVYIFGGLTPDQLKQLFTPSLKELTITGALPQQDWLPESHNLEKLNIGEYLTPQQLIEFLKAGTAERIGVQFRIADESRFVDDLRRALTAEGAKEALRKCDLRDFLMPVSEWEVTRELQ